MFTVKPFGKVVICGATSGYTLDFDVRYLWMKQKEILGSHFANAYECMRANQLMAEGKVRPVLWKAMGFEGVPDAHQLLHENKHAGKITIMVGATDKDEGQHEDGDGRDLGRGGRLAAGRIAAMHVNYIDWHVTPVPAPTAGSRSGGRRSTAPSPPAPAPAT